MPRPDPARIVVALPDVPELVHLGDLPASIDVRLVPPAPARAPDLADVEVIVPYGSARATTLDCSPGEGIGSA
jgi:hypothetical protein